MGLVKNSTTYAKGKSQGRPPGARNLIRREVRTMLQKLEREKTFDPRKVFLRLQAIAMGSDIPAAVSAAKVLLEYRFGKPLNSIDVDVQHDVGPTVMQLLEGIAQSDAHRRTLEERERKSLRAASITVEPEKESEPS